MTKLGEFLTRYFERKGKTAYSLTKNKNITQHGLKLALSGQDIRVSTLCKIANILEIPNKDLTELFEQLRKEV
jgi:predicted transcriptional regulator